MQATVNRKKAVYAIIPAAGTGSRMKTSQNKPFLQIGRFPVIIRTLLVFESHPRIDGFLIAAQADEVAAMTQLVTQYELDKCLGIVPGGKTRTLSVMNGLDALKRTIKSAEVSLVVVHDGARCFVTPDIISRVIAGIETFGACGAAVAVHDTIKHISDDGRVLETLPRSRLRAMQTPQGSTFDRLYTAYRQVIEKGLTATDDLAVLEEAGIPVYLVEGDFQNLKLTTPEDRLLAEKLAAAIDGDVEPAD
ncbi:MAG: 2-C-methyl-D-erythritol 4-phosphate cytidylyltransferase [Saccharofermentanales bacterium]